MQNHQVIIIPTKKCDLRCSHCMRDSFVGDEMSVEMLDRFVSEIKEKNPKIKFALSGGEPTVHSDLSGILSVFNKHNVPFIINTNGISVKGRSVVIEQSRNIDHINVSLDSPTERFNDIVRGTGSFKAAMDSVEEYLKAGIGVTLRYVLHDDNAESMLQCYEHTYDLAVRYPNVKLTIAISSFHKSIKLASSVDRLKSLAKGDDLSSSDKTIATMNSLREIYKNNKKYSIFNILLVDRHLENNTVNFDWTKEKCSNVQDYTTHPENEIVFLPDGKVSYCCDLYDIDYNCEKFRNAGPNSPLSHIIGDYNVESLDSILSRKISHTEILMARRFKDFSSSLLVGDRSSVCDNCKFYHHQPTQEYDKTYPVIKLTQI